MKFPSCIVYGNDQSATPIKHRVNVWSEIFISNEILKSKHESMEVININLGTTLICEVDKIQNHCLFGYFDVFILVDIVSEN